MRKGVAAFVADWSHTEGVITEVNILGKKGQGGKSEGTS